MSALIIIEGLIGAGKSTLCTNLMNTYGWTTLFEPVDENPYLDKFYADPKIYGLEMQFWLMSRRFQQHQIAVETIWRQGKTVLMDRSIYGDNVFCKKNYLDGNITKDGLENYQKMQDVMLRYLMVPHYTIYLDASPASCLDRIKLRSRDCELGISLEYLQGLQEIYYDLLDNLAHRGSHVVRVPWDTFLSTDKVMEIIQTETNQLFAFPDYPKINPDLS
jgi:deoxyadenosine kinase